MGADIHLYVEKKVDGQWQAVRGDNPRIKDYRRYAENHEGRGDSEQAENYRKYANEIESGEQLKQAEDDYDRDYYAPKVLEDWVYNGRNYDLFAILADVRNGYGFAGSYTGEGFKPISEPKDIPSDVSVEVEKASENYGIDGHSHSWFTVKELNDYDWEQETVTLRAGWYEMRTPLEELKQNTETALYKDCVGNFYTETIPKLKELAGNDLESVRIVFWFDN
jgi:hypothetical protein